MMYHLQEKLEKIEKIKDIEKRDKIKSEIIREFIYLRQILDLEKSIFQYNSWKERNIKEIIKIQNKIKENVKEREEEFVGFEKNLFYE